LAWTKGDKKSSLEPESELNASALKETDEKENNPENQSGTEIPNKKPVAPQGPLNRMFQDESLKTFCRRLSFSPRGELLAVPAAVLPQNPQKNDTSEADDTTAKEESPIKKDPDVKPVEPPNKDPTNHAVAFFCRNSFTNPCALIATGSSYSVACRFCPVYFNRKRDPFAYGKLNSLQLSYIW